MDIASTTAPKSDQQNFDDYANGVTRDVTISEVRAGGEEQPVEIHLVEFPGRPFKPSKSMRRVLLAAWVRETAEWSGRRMRLYGDPTVKFGGQTVGGIRIAALSHIEKKLSVSLTVTRGKRAPFVVEPLADAAPTTDPTQAAVDAFARGGITQAQLETHVGKSRADWTTADVKTLTDLFTSLRNKEKTKEQVFGGESDADQDTPPPGGDDDPWAQDTLTGEAAS